MFAAAVSQAMVYTRPVIISSAKTNGSCDASIGAFVVVNDEGWILTAAHIVQMIIELKARKQKHVEVSAQRDAITADASLKPEQRKKRLRDVPVPSDGIVAFSSWWSWDAATVDDFTVIPGADLAAAKLSGFPGLSLYPSFKDPAKDIQPGTSLCRLGFPFHRVQPSYADNRFVLPPETFPLAFFPNDGILTRRIVVRSDPEFPIEFIETSTPGLKGQSGGPIFDKHGTIWGIQSHTASLPLNFAPKVPGEREGTIEHQFLNVGRGAHPGTIAHVLNKLGVKHTLSAY